MGGNILTNREKDVFVLLINASQANRARADVIAIKKGKSIFFVEALNFTFEKIETIPSIKNVLHIFEPITLLTDKSTLFCIALVILTDNSGKLVPIATIVSPINIAGILSFFATALAPLTK